MNFHKNYLPNLETELLTHSVVCVCVCVWRTSEFDVIKRYLNSTALMGRPIQEFASWYDGPLEEEEMRDVFRHIDQDASGFVSASELLQWFTHEGLHEEAQFIKVIIIIIMILLPAATLGAVRSTYWKILCPSVRAVLAQSSIKIIIFRIKSSK